MLEDALTVRARAEGVERFVVGAVVHAGDRVLLLTRSESDDFLPGIEEVPSGGVEPTETLGQGLDRELREEIGFGAGNVDAGFLSEFDYLSRTGRRVRQFTVSVALEGRFVRLSSEHSKSRWITATDVASTSATPETKRVLAEWFAWSTSHDRF